MPTDTALRARLTWLEERAERQGRTITALLDLVTSLKDAHSLLVDEVGLLRSVLQTHQTILQDHCDPLSLPSD